MRDYIGDMLTRIRNGQKANLGEVLLHPYTPNKCIKILSLLEKEGYIYGWTQCKIDEKDNKNKKSQIKVILKYNGQGKSVIQGIYRISKPGCKVYISTKAL